MKLGERFHRILSSSNGDIIAKMSPPRAVAVVVELILVAANIEYTWARTAPASCDFAIAGRRQVARARGSLKIVSPFAHKILFHCYMYVKCVLLFVVIEKMVNAHAGKPRTVKSSFGSLVRCRTLDPRVVGSNPQPI